MLRLNESFIVLFKYIFNVFNGNQNQYYYITLNITLNGIIITLY